MRVNLSKRDLATVLAALRSWQRMTEKEGVPASEHFDDETSLNSGEIDNLCERLNFGDRT